MTILGHLLLSVAAGAVIWLLSGSLIDAVDRVAKRYHKPGFAVAFFILGILTSVSEMSVATNATLERVPQVSAGNLLGASTVIFLLIIPLLAVLGNGIPTSSVLLPSNMALVLAVVLLPAALALDGSVSPVDGLLSIAAYLWLVWRIHSKHPLERRASQVLDETQRELTGSSRATAVDTLKIAVAAVLIFICGNVLVDESVYFAALLSVPVSFIGLMVLSIGTNLPELVIAIRCVVAKHKDIAFGDYMGSAAFNTPIFGVLPLFAGTFAIESSEALLTCVLLGIGLVLFFWFIRGKRTFTRTEGAILLVLYVCFLALQIGNIVRLEPTLHHDTLLKTQVPTHLSDTSHVSIHAAP